MADTLYEHLPPDIRGAVDGIVEAIAPEDWPNRFLYLFGLLCEKLENRADPDPSPLLQQWAGIVTAVMERLPPDIAIIECQALMSISYNTQWRTQALAQLDRDPNTLDRILFKYPAWSDVVESIEAAAHARPI